MLCACSSAGACTRMKSSDIHVKVRTQEHALAFVGSSVTQESPSSLVTNDGLSHSDISRAASERNSAFRSARRAWPAIKGPGLDLSVATAARANVHRGADAFLKSVSSVNAHSHIDASATSLRKCACQLSNASARASASWTMS